jgi:hypothetical protein
MDAGELLAVTPADAARHSGRSERIRLHLNSAAACSTAASLSSPSLAVPAAAGNTAECASPRTSWWQYRMRPPAGGSTPHATCQAARRVRVRRDAVRAALASTSSPAQQGADQGAATTAPSTTLSSCGSAAAAATAAATAAVTAATAATSTHACDQFDVQLRYSIIGQLQAMHTASELQQTGRAINPGPLGESAEVHLQQQQQQQQQQPSAVESRAGNFCCFGYCAPTGLPSTVTADRRGRSSSSIPAAHEPAGPILTLLTVEPASALFFHVQRAWLGAHMRDALHAAGTTVDAFAPKITNHGACAGVCCSSSIMLCMRRVCCTSSRIAPQPVCVHLM